MKEGGLILWSNGNNDQAYGSWNPSHFSHVSDWEVGDEIVLMDFPRPFEQNVQSDAVRISTTTTTGWNIGAENVRFGRCGIVGAWWKEMEIEYDIGKNSSISGVWTDSVNLPYSIKYYDDNNNEKKWVVWRQDCKGTISGIDSPKARRWRLCWNSTDLHQTKGLSTYRSGGGLHAELILRNSLKI